MSQISQSTQKLIQLYQFWYQSLQLKEGVSTIHVDEVASTVASFYEKIRGVVEWKEEHLLRKAAIERALKRRLFLRKNGEKIAEPLICELIRGGHFPNDKIEETKIAEVQKIINKYIFILKNSPAAGSQRERLQFYNWILEIAACEIEEILAPFRREKALINYMFELMKERIRLKEGIFVMREIGKDEEKDIQIYIAVQQALFKLDPPLISYHLINYKYPQWKNPTEEFLAEITRNIYNIWTNIEKDLSHPLGKKIYAICERYDTAYLILGDILSKNQPNPQKVLENPEVLENSIRESYQERLKKLKTRIGRAAIYSTISIFLTKMLIAFVIEFPFDKYVLGRFSYQSLGFNIFIPPLLMFFLVLTIRPPTKENLQQVIMEVMKIVYEKERKDIYEIRFPKRRGVILNTIIISFYLLTFIISFGIIIWGLNKLNFSILSTIIFLAFFCLISFAGVKIRERAKELQFLEKNETIFHIIFDFFTLPIIRTGKWLSGKLASYNVIVVLITALIDFPFHLFVEFLEQWRYFLKEKKEEIH